MRYYSTQRPITPGAYPKENVISIKNFHDKKYVSENIEASAHEYRRRSKKRRAVISYKGDKKLSHNKTGDRR